MKFRSRRDLFVSLVIYGAIAIMLVPMVSFPKEVVSPVGIAVILFILAVSALLLWILHGTWYCIDNSHVTYRSGPVKGKIEIGKIHTVVSGKNLYIGFRPATANKGLIVKYGKYDEIYFSPDSNEGFIAALLKINPGIKVERY